MPAWGGLAPLMGLVLSLAVAHRALAQGATSGATPVAKPSAPLVPPGDSALQGSRIAAGTARYALTMYRDADEIPVGRLTDEIRLDTVAETAPRSVLLRRVQRLQRGTMELLDSTVTEVATLAPRWHRSLQPTRRLLLEFSGRRVKGSVGPVDVPPVPIDTTLPVPVFDSGNWDLFVRALPLAPGYAARFPVYDTDAGLREYQVEVTGSTTIQGEEAHVVLFTLGKGRESVVWIGTQSRELLQMETMLAPTTLLRQVRLR